MKEAREITRGCPSGFTLMEVLVAIMVFVIGILGVMGLSLHSTRMLASSSVRARSVQALIRVSDSLEVAGATGSGTHVFPGGRVRWRIVGSVAGGLNHVRLEARGAPGRDASIPGSDPSPVPMVVLNLLVNGFPVFVPLEDADSS